MFTIQPYQAASLVSMLTKAADTLEGAGNGNWFAVGRAAACIEDLMHGTIPIDIADTAAHLKASAASIKFAEPRLAICIDLAIAFIDGVRLGLLVIESRPRPAAPVWIGIDMGTGDRTVCGGRHHA